MFSSRGLQISFIGAVVFFFSLLALLVLPAGPSIVGMGVGGAAICGGFLSTLLSYHEPSDTPPT